MLYNNFYMLKRSRFMSPKIKSYLFSLSLFFSALFAGCSLLILAGCESNSVIITDVDEREANQIVVFLAGRGITAYKVSAPTGGAAGESAMPKFNISVEEGKVTEAMSLLSQNGLPRKKGTDLLTLFAKQGLMSTEREETVRYQAGLAEQIANTIRKIDGILDADVQISFPPETTGVPGVETNKKITASVYLKHQGIVDDPNSHLITKIKLLVSGSVTGLNVNDVTVISDRARLTDMLLAKRADGMAIEPKEYVKVWGITVNKDSAGRFRFLFLVLLLLTLICISLIGWSAWKFYPMISKKNFFKNFFKPTPITHEEKGPPGNE